MPAALVESRFSERGTGLNASHFRKPVENFAAGNPWKIIYEP
jgi:hypothetical protein